MQHQAIKVLHVEDDETDALLMQQILHDEVGANQFEIVHVQNLKSALLKLKDKGYQAVLLDLNLEDIRGVDNVSAIKTENPDLPVIVLSGVDNHIVAMEALERGAQDYLIKGHCDGKVIRMALHSSIRTKEIERKLFRQANYDDLTDLPNRRLYQDYLERAITRAARKKSRETIMFLDIDNFKYVNDTYGHGAGNDLLRECADRIKTVLRASDIAARYGGDEFILLLDDSNNDPQFSAGQVATKLLYAFNKPFIFGNDAVECSMSIGIATYPDAAMNLGDLVNAADKAMYEAKKAGGHQFRFADNAKS